MNAKQVSDAKRLAVTLDQYADDPATVKKLAAALHYMLSAESDRRTAQHIVIKCK